MNEHFEGTWFDGRSGRAHAAVLRRVGARHYRLEGDGVERNGALAELALTPRLARIARTVEFADGARLQLAADAAIDAWFPHQGRGERLVDRLERHASVVAASILLCIASLVAGAVWGVPWLADRIALAIPPAVERSLGDQVLAGLDRLGLAPSGLAPERREELAARFARLAGPAGHRLEFRTAEDVGPNAFALPGGIVVVTDELVDLLHDDRQFDAVVAHELGHQQHHHALRQTLRGSLVAIVAALFAGDVSSAGAVVVALPTFLLDSHYSRGFEEEADRHAFDLLARHEESPFWFAEAMRRLHAAYPDDEGYAYLSSHPPTAERIAAAEAAARAFALAHPRLCPYGVCPGEEIEAGQGVEVDFADDAEDSADGMPECEGDCGAAAPGADATGGQ